MDKEAQEKVAQWVSYAKRSTMEDEWLAGRILELMKELGYRKIKDKPLLLSDKDVVYRSEKSEFSKGDMGITIGTLKRACFSNVSHQDIDKNIDLIKEAQRDSDWEYIKKHYEGK